MSYVVVEDVAASWEQYAPIAADLERRPPTGLIVHAAGRTDEGVRIVEVWASAEAWHRYADEADLVADRPFSTAPRHLRDLTPAHVVIGREV